MLHIILIGGLTNTAAIWQMCNESNEPISITQNGNAYMVIMSMRPYEKKVPSECVCKAGRSTSSHWAGDGSATGIENTEDKARDIKSWILARPIWVTVCSQPLIWKTRRMVQLLGIYNSLHIYFNPHVMKTYSYCLCSYLIYISGDWINAGPRLLWIRRRLYGLLLLHYFTPPTRWGYNDPEIIIFPPQKGTAHGRLRCNHDGSCNYSSCSQHRIPLLESGRRTQKKENRKELRIPTCLYIIWASGELLNSKIRLT